MTIEFDGHHANNGGLIQVISLVCMILSQDLEPSFSIGDGARDG